MLTIDHLPTEILDKIFKLFSYPQQTSCANVCRRWNSIITNSPLLSFDIAKESEVFGTNSTFYFVPNLTAICLLLKRDAAVFEMAQKLIQLQGKTLEKVILSPSTNVNHDKSENPQRGESYYVGKDDLIYELTNLPFITDLVINFPVPVFHQFNDKAYQLLHHLSLDVSHSSQSYSHTCGGNAQLWCNLLTYSGASIEPISPYPINRPQVNIDYSKLRIFSEVEFLSLRTNSFDDHYANDLFTLLPNLTNLTLTTWSYDYSALIEVCIQYEQLTHLKIRVWACCGMKYHRYELKSLLINDNIIDRICNQLPNLISLDLHGHLDLTNQSLETLNQKNNLVSIRITNGGILFHELCLYGAQRQPSVQFSEDALIDFAKKHPLLEQLELYVGRMTILKPFIDRLAIHCPRIKLLKLHNDKDTE